MKALLKTNTKFHKAGEWVEIDTTCLFNNQYNADKERIFDGQVSRIVDDARPGMGKCRYCGNMVKRGEEEKHFAEEEAKTCEDCGNGKKCFWWMDRLVKTERGPRNVEKRIGENGEVITTTTQTVTEKYEKYCAYKENDGCCKNTEHRRMGVEWFTAENTFFLKYPNGFDSIPAVDKLPTHGFIVRNDFLNATYCKTLGCSYTLKAILSYNEDCEKATGISYFRIYNSRKDYKFRYEDGAFYTDKYSVGWRKVKTLDGIPQNVISMVKMICNGLTCDKETEAC